MSKIIVFKSKDYNVDLIIDYEVHASAAKPDVKKHSFDIFVLIGDTDLSGTRVYAVGRVKKISKITPASKVLQVFGSSNFSTWKWEFELIDLIDLREDSCVIDDIFLQEDLPRIRYTQQFTYVDWINIQAVCEGIPLHMLPVFWQRLLVASQQHQTASQN